jgi:hypothetical protein
MKFKKIVKDNRDLEAVAITFGFLTVLFLSAMILSPTKDNTVTFVMGIVTGMFLATTIISGSAYKFTKEEYWVKI